MATTAGSTRTACSAAASTAGSGSEALKRD
jgi:hypothetical protein